MMIMPDNTFVMQYNYFDLDEMNAEHFHLAASKRDWRAIRVDLIGSTTAQYPFAQVGWTGNKQYNRLLRQYAKDSLGYSLSSSGLYDMRQVGTSAFCNLSL